MKKILVIDDERSIRKLLRRLLEKESYHVIEAQNGKQGIDFYNEHKPDLIITDLIMPEKEGLESIAELKKINSVVPIIAISGGGVGDPGIYLNLAKNMGANYAFSKPVNHDELLLTINTLLE